MTIAKDRVPASGTSGVRWGEVIQVPLHPVELPPAPVALALRITLRSGYAGCGWYDEDGLAEEIQAGPGPCTRTIFLKLWTPALCRKLVIRNVRSEPLDVTLEHLIWLPLRTALTSQSWNSSLQTLPKDTFLDLPFEGLLTEKLWRNREDRPHQQTDFRLRRLKLLVSLAWQHCPGYREWWSHHGWHPSDLRSLTDAANIPIITKEQMRDNLDAFSLSRRNPLIASTSGSTGQPFSFRYTSALRAAHFSHAAAAFSYAAPDLLPTQIRLASLTTRPVRGLSATGSAGSLMLSHAALRQPDILRELLHAYQPTAFFGITSCAEKFADAIEDKYRFRVAVLCSESMLPSQINAAGRMADVVIATYGLSEGASFAVRCPSCGNYAELPRLSATTLHRRSDGLLDIVGTGFWSLGTLFINYATGDLAAGCAHPCPTCPTFGGAHLTNILGRNQDTLLDHDGSRHTLALLYRVLIQYMPQIKLYDFVQVEPGYAKLRYASFDNIPLEHEPIERALRYVVPSLTISLQFTPQLLEHRERLASASKWKLIKTSVEASLD